MKMSIIGSIYFRYPRRVLLSLYVYPRIVESPAPPSSVPPLRRISYVPDDFTKNLNFAAF